MDTTVFMSGTGHADRVDGQAVEAPSYFTDHASIRRLQSLIQIVKKYRFPILTLVVVGIRQVELVQQLWINVSRPKQY